MNGTAMPENVTHEQCADTLSIGRTECKYKAGEKNFLVKNASTF